MQYKISNLYRFKTDTLGSTRFSFFSVDSIEMLRLKECIYGKNDAHTKSNPHKMAHIEETLTDAMGHNSRRSIREK